MSSKKIVYLGCFIGSSIGGMVPALWGDDLFSMWGLLWSLVGGLVGIWAGYRVSKAL